MARNKDRYEYIELAIVRDSPLLQALLDDAAASGKPAAQVAVQRLADYYRASSRSSPGQAHLPAQILQATAPPAARLSTAQEEPARRLPAAEQSEAMPIDDRDEELEYQTEQARANALAALDALDAWN